MYVQQPIDTLMMGLSGQLQEYNKGDPLGSLIFAPVLHPLVHRTQNNSKRFLHAWYLNYGMITGWSEEVAKTLDIIRQTGPGIVLELNV